MAFFSGTDSQELYDNTKFHPAYLSLIVNCDKKYCAKIAYMGKRTFESREKITFKNNDPERREYYYGDNEFNVEMQEEDVLCTINMEIEIEGQVPTITTEQLDRYTLISKPKAYSYTPAVSYPSKWIKSRMALKADNKKNQTIKDFKYNLIDNLVRRLIIKVLPESAKEKDSNIMYPMRTVIGILDTYTDTFFDQEKAAKELFKNFDSVYNEVFEKDHNKYDRAACIIEMIDKTEVNRSDCPAYDGFCERLEQYIVEEGLAYKFEKYAAAK